MEQLSRCIMTLDETDYDWAAVQYKRIRPKFDGVVDGLSYSYPTSQDDEAAKTAIKADMTIKGITRDSEI